jgi:hypothetical protein
MKQKRKRIDPVRIEWATMIFALFMLIFSLLGLLGYVTDNPLILHLQGVMLGITIAQIVIRRLSPSPENNEDESGESDSLFDNRVLNLTETDLARDEELHHAISVIYVEIERRELEQQGRGKQ